MRREHMVLTALTGLHGLVGTVIATRVPGPLLSADDLAFEAMGRTLAGEGAAPLGSQPPYGVLYPVLLAPGWLLGLDEPGMLVWARVVNAVAGALLVPVLYFLVRRLTDAGAPIALVAAVVGASLPAHMVTGSIVWTERLLALLVAGSLLALCRLAESRSLGRALAVAGVAVALHATHPRMGVAAVVVLAAAAWLALGSKGPALAAVTAGATGIALSEWARRALSDRAFGDTGLYDVGDLASRRDLGDVPDMVMRAGGTVAYLVLATAGLAVIGLVVLWRAGAVGRWALGAFGAVVAVAGWFLIGVDRFGDGVPRADAHLHGRYVEVFAPVLVALGIVGLRSLGRWPALACVGAAPIVAGFFGAWAGPGNNWNRPRSPVMMLGTEAGGAPFGNDIFEPGAAALVAVVVGGSFVAADRRRRPQLVAVVGALAVALGTASALEAVDQLYDTSVAGAVETALAEVEVEQLAIDTDRVSSNLAAAMAWEVGFDRATSEIGPGASHVLLPAGAVAPAGARVVVELGDASLWELG